MREVGRTARSLYSWLPRPLRRGAVLVAGAALAAAGLAMLVLPGPGVLVLGLAVALLAVEFDWAKRLGQRLTRLTTAMCHRLRAAKN